MIDPEGNMADLIVNEATVLSFERDSDVLERCDVVVRDGRIADLGEGAARLWSAPENIDGRDLVLVPGLCNGHTHSPEALARGLADGKPLAEWLGAVWSRLDRIDPEAVRRGVLLCAAEMLHGGVTAVVDHFRQTPACGQSVDAAACAWLESGMKATLAVMIRDRVVPHWVSHPLSAGAQVDVLRNAIEKWDGRSGRIQVSVAPSAPTRCSDVLLSEAGVLCSNYGVGLHMHVDETREEMALARELYGKTAVRHLDDLALLGPHVSLAHCVWCEPDDLDILAATRTAVVHNPVSNLRLGSGRAAVERMLGRGIEVVIGTDGAASNDSQNVLEAVKMAALLPRLFLEDPNEWITASDALGFATTRAGHVFAMGEGRLAVGCRADFAAFERASLPLAPANDLYCQLAFAGAGIRARHVVVDGRMVLRDHEILTFDERDVVGPAT